MSKVADPHKPPPLSSLYHKLIEPAKQQALFVQSHESYLQNPAQHISNHTFRDSAGLANEKARLDDKTLRPHIESLANSLKQTETQGTLSKSVIEFDCGLGLAAFILAKKEFILYSGVESSENILRVVRGSAKNRGIDRERFQPGEVLHFSANINYDAAIALDVLSTLSPVHQLNALAKLNHLLRPRGQLFLRWAAGDNDIQTRTASTSKGTVTGWVFRASQGYIELLLAMTKFDLHNIDTDMVAINAETLPEKHYVVVAGKGLDL